MGLGHLDPRLLAPELERMCCCVLNHQHVAGSQQQQNDRGSVWCPQGLWVCLPGRGCSVSSHYLRSQQVLWLLEHSGGWPT